MTAFGAVPYVEPLPVDQSKVRAMAGQGDSFAAYQYAMCEYMRGRDTDAFNYMRSSARLGYLPAMLMTQAACTRHSYSLLMVAWWF